MLSKRKFCVYTSNVINGEYRITNRLIPINFRKQEKSIGLSSFILKRQERLDEFGLELGKDENDGQYIEDIRVGQFIKITYWSEQSETILGTPGDTLWHGNITSIVEDRFAGDTADSIGMVNGAEIGIYLSKVPIIFSSSIPIFNPVLDDYFILNKKVDTLDFEKSNVKKFKVDSKETEYIDVSERNYLWTREDAIKYVCSKSLIGSEDVTFPWKNVDDKPNFKTFVSRNKPTSFPSPENKSLIEWLDEVIESPFSYYIDYVTSTELGLVIFNKSTVALPNICSARDGGVTIFTESENHETDVTNFSISRSDDKYDKVIVRGNKVLWYGALSTFNHAGAASLEKGWTYEQEKAYINGYVNSASELAFPEGDARNEATIKEGRKALWKVYRYFKFKSFTESGRTEWLTTTNTAGEPLSGVNRVPFCGTVQFASAGMALTNPIIDLSWQSSTVPSKSNIQWADKMPLRFSDRRDYFVDQDQTEQLSDVNLIARGLLPGTTKTYYFIPDAYPVKLSFLVDGIKAERTEPQMSALDKEDLFKWNGTTYGQEIPQSWTNAPFCALNPTSSRGTVEADTLKGNPIDYDYTNYATYIFNVACYSDQYMEASAVRNTVPVDSNKVKIIEDTSLNCWVAHKGAVVGTNREDLYRETKATIYRNDYPKLLDLLTSTKNWFFTDKKSIKLDYMLMNFTEVPIIGKLISKIKEPKQSGTIAVNTCVSSIEWDAGDSQPRVIISTEIPEIPLFNRMQTQRINADYPQSLPDTFSPIQRQTENIIKGNDQPVIGELRSAGGGGSGGGAEHYHLTNGTSRYGMGPAFATPLPFSSSQLRALGWINIS